LALTKPVYVASNDNLSVSYLLDTSNLFHTSFAQSFGVLFPFLSLFLFHVRVTRMVDNKSEPQSQRVSLEPSGLKGTYLPVLGANKGSKIFFLIRNTFERHFFLLLSSSLSFSLCMPNLCDDRRYSNISHSQRS